MPLPSSVRSALGSAPVLDRTSTPPALQNHPPPALDGLSYSQFEFDKSADRLGDGGNAVVYQATVAPDTLTVALKRPFPGKTVPPQTCRKLLNEGEKWAAVDDHPYIASVFDWGMDGPPWIAIEYLAGGTLAERSEEMSVSQRLWTAYALVDAVAYATAQHGLTHHDLHPQNVLLQQTPDGVWDVPKIVDWGLSRELIQHTGSVSQATPEYAAPEHFDALMPDVPVGPHTDVYQLGVVCYELLTGSHPDHLRDDVVPPAQIDPALPPEIEQPILQALVHDRDDRTAHPLLLREKLEDAIEQTVPEPAVTPGTTTEPATFEVTITSVDAVTAGETVTVAYEVTNTGDQRDTQEIEFSVDGPTEGTEAGVTLNGGETFRGQFSYDTVAGDAPGVEVSVASADGTATEAVTVEPPRTTAPWPMFQGGPARTGHHPRVTGPSKPVTTQWTVDTSDWVRSSPAVANGTVYVGSDDNSVYAIDASDGTTQWTVDTGYWVRSSPAVANDTVYVGSTDDSVYAIDASDGTTQWTLDTGGSVWSSPTVANGTVYVGSNDNSVYAIDASDGNIQWTAQTDGRVVRSSPVVANGIVYVGSEDNSVYAIDASDGTTQWTLDTGGSVWSSPAVANGTVYVGSYDCSVYAIDASDGTTQWTLDTGGLVKSSPAVANGTVYVGNKDYSVYAIDASDGTTQWTLYTGGSVHSSPAVANGTVYVGSDDNSVYAINASDGTTQWTVDTGDWVRSSPAVANGTVYVGSRNNSVYAIEFRPSRG